MQNCIQSCALQGANEQMVLELGLHPYPCLRVLSRRSAKTTREGTCIAAPTAANTNAGLLILQTPTCKLQIVIFALCVSEYSQQTAYAAGLKLLMFRKGVCYVGNVQRQRRDRPTLSCWTWVVELAGIWYASSSQSVTAFSVGGCQ